MCYEVGTYSAANMIC